MDNTQDYSFVDQFIQDSLDSYNKQLFGNYDDNTGYYEEIKPEENVDEESQPSDVSEDQINNDDNNQQQSEEDMYNSMFSEDNIMGDYGGGNIGGLGRVGATTSPGSRPGFRSYSSYQEGRQALLNQLKLYQTGKSKTGIKPDTTLLGAMSIYAPSSDGNDPKHYAEVVAKEVGVTINTPISKIDPNKWADAITKMEGNKVGNNPGNLRYQAGGIPAASTRQQQYIGLNNSQHDEMFFPMEGENEFRGLDSYDPIMIEDETGKRKILHGPKHKAKFKGKVYEKKL